VPNTQRAASSRAPSSYPAPLDRTASATVAMQIDRDIFVRLRPFAIKRDVPVTQLIQTLLGVIAADQLTDAILDDQ